MFRKPEFGFLVAALTLAFLTVGWTTALLPLANFPVFVGSDADGAYVIRVRSGVPPASTGGLSPGDRVDLSALSYVQKLRLQMGAGSRDALTLRARHNGTWSDRTITAVPSTLPLDKPQFWSLYLSMTINMLVALVVVARRPSVATAAFAVYAWGGLPSFRFIYGFAWLPDPIFAVVATALEMLLATLPVFFLLPFVTRFPTEPTSRAGRRRMRVSDATLLAGFAICAFYAIFEPVRHHTWVNAANLLGTIVALIGGVLAALGYREASGEHRRRIGWVLAGYTVTIAAFVASNAMITAQVFVPVSLQATVQVAESALAIALAYAILRHRVIDVGFALNRTVVYGAVTVVIVVAVSLIDWLAGRLIGETRLALAAEAAVTIALGVALNAIHERIGRFVERILFRARHAAERRLRNGIDALAFATTEGAIERALTDEVATALALRSSALFRIDLTAERYRCVRATDWPGDVATIDDDALLVRTLRLRERPFFLADFAVAERALPSGPTAPVLAVPVADRHQLVGFVLYGPLADGTAPDPELVDLLGRLGSAAASSWTYVEARAARARLGDIEKLLAEPPVSAHAIG